MRLETVTGSFEAYGHSVTLVAIGIEVDAEVYFAAQYGFPRNVLGRQGWLSRLRLCVIDYDGEILASVYDKTE